MRSTLDRTGRIGICLGLATGMELAGAVACRSMVDATPGERVVYPTPQAPAASSLTDGAATPDAVPEEMFSPLDIAIASDCVPFAIEDWSRPWSQNVLERDCTEDSECGDGHCDRGRCRAIWTCTRRYGQRCVNDRMAPSSYFQARFCRGICIDGRCRSCVSDQECVDKLGNSSAGCGLYERDGHRGCGLSSPSMHRPVPSQP
jgi:hypothetical protein